MTLEMTRALRSALLFTLLSLAASLNLPFGLKLADFDAPTAVLPGANPTITNAPSVDFVELRLLQARTLPSILPCATSCFNSVATKSTNCKANDFVCGCESVNANIIELGAYGCVQSACGVYAAEDFCSSVNDGDYESDTTDKATTTDGSAASATKSVVIVTKTGDSGSVVTSTVAGPHQTESSGGSSGSSDGTTGNSKSSGLSKGGIAGIAVGAAGGAVLICAVIFLVYRCTRKRQTYAAVAPSDAPASTGSSPMGQPPVPVAANHLISGKPELDGKTNAFISTASPGTLNVSEISRHPSVVSNTSPQLAPGMPVAPVGPMAVHPSAMSELQAGSWQYGGHQPWHPSQAPPPGYGGPVSSSQPGIVHHEMQGPPPPELMGNTQMPQEMHGYAYNGGVYEMPGNRMT